MTNPARRHAPRPTRLVALALAVLAALPATSTGQERGAPPSVGDVFSTSGVDPCETPARGPGCPRVRWGWGNCPGGREACDWCYGRRGVFAYARRTNRGYKLSSGCDRLSELPPGDVFWTASTPELADAFASAGSECVDVPRLGLVCQLPDDGGGGRPRPRGGPDERPRPRPSSAPRPRPRCDELAARVQSAWRPAAAGVRYAALSNGGGTLHAFEVTRPLRVVYARDGVTLPGLVRSTPGVVGGVTGTYSASPARPPYVAGPVVLDGVMAAPPEAEVNLFRHLPRSLLAQGADGAWTVTDLPAFGQGVARPAAWRQLKSLSEAAAERQGLGGLGRLLANGRDTRQPVAIARQGFDAAQAGTGRNARALAGLMGDGRTFLFLVQSGDSARGTGEGVDVLTCVLQRLGAEDGVLLDGGGSAQAFLRQPGSGPRARPAEVDSRAGQAGARALPTWILF